MEIINTVKLFKNDPYYLKWYPDWIENSMENYETIKSQYMSAQAKGLEQQPNENRPAIVIGSGASLDNDIEKLKDWDGVILASQSNAFNLIKEAGIEPDYLLVLDSHPRLADQIRGYDWKSATLIAHPHITPPLLKEWQRDILYFRRLMPQIELFEITLPLQYPRIVQDLYWRFCVANTIVDIAHYMLGCNPIYTLGMDFGWKAEDDHPTRCRKWHCDNNNFTEGKRLTHKEYVDTRDEKLIYDRGYVCRLDDLSFKRGFLALQVLNDEINIIDCSDGIVHELKEGTIEQAIATPEYGRYTDRERELTNSLIVETRKLLKLQRMKETNR